MDACELFPVQLLFQTRHGFSMGINATGKVQVHVISRGFHPLNIIHLDDEFLAEFFDQQTFKIFSPGASPFVINGQRIVIFRVILGIRMEDNERTAAIMFNENGSCIESTDNFQNEII